MDGRHTCRHTRAIRGVYRSRCSDGARSIKFGEFSVAKEERPPASVADMPPVAKRGFALSSATNYIGYLFARFHPDLSSARLPGQYAFWSPTVGRES